MHYHRAHFSRATYFVDFVASMKSVSLKISKNSIMTQLYCRLKRRLPFPNLISCMKVPKYIFAIASNYPISNDSYSNLMCSQTNLCVSCFWCTDKWLVHKMTWLHAHLDYLWHRIEFSVTSLYLSEHWYAHRIQVKTFCKNDGEYYIKQDTEKWWCPSTKIVVWPREHHQCKNFFLELPFLVNSQNL